MNRKLFVSLFLLVSALFGWAASPGRYVTVKGGQLFRNGAPYYFVGTNMWYAPILGSTGEGGNRDRLLRELDSLKSIGVDNLRILVGPDAGGKNARSVYPYLQQPDGALNDTLLDGLDFLLKELEQRNMLAVLYLNNSWDWSGGYTYYLKRTGMGDAPDATQAYQAYTDFAANFLRQPKAQEAFADFVRKIVTRTNRYTQRPYADSPAIMSWQICNEPRPFAQDTKEAFAAWISQTAKLIRQLDPNHLVSTGSEGLYGCESDERLLEKVCNDLNIDYLTIHIWPVNWQWASAGSLYTALPNVYVKAGQYIGLHLRLAKKIQKPLVIEEFGYPRNQNFRLAGTPTSYRDAFYNFIFDKVLESKRQGDYIAGCNFWGWGGAGRPADKTWQRGNDYLCDPPHEPQGWYSVYNSDSTTIRLIQKYAEALR